MKLFLTHCERGKSWRIGAGLLIIERVSESERERERVREREGERERRKTSNLLC